jgi:predicted transcriptional regulator
MHRLNKTEISILQNLLHGEKTVKELCEDVNRSLTQTSALVLALFEKGFVSRHRDGMVYKVSFSSNTFAVILKELMNRKFPVERFISDSRMDVAAILAGANRPLKTREIAIMSGLSPSIVRYAIHDMIRHGILRKSATSYRMSERMEKLRKFLLEYSFFTNHRMISRATDDAIIEWQMGFEFIFTSEDVLEERYGVPTGVTAFSNDGVTIYSNRFTYHHAPNVLKLRREDWIVDNILAHPDSITYLLYSLIYLKKNLERVDPAYLEQKAFLYGLESMGSNMVSYVLENESIPGFPSHKEFNEKYMIYGGKGDI